MLRGQWGNCAGWPGDGSHAGHLVVGVDLSVFFLGTFASWEMCWDLLGYEMIWNVVQTCPKPLLSQFLSPGPLVPLMFSKMSSKHIKASPVILYTFIYIYVYKHIITYVDISSWFQNMCMASKSSRLDTTRDDVFLRLFAGCPRYEAWWGLLQKRQTQ